MITKVVKPRRIRLGQSARWTITIRNLGPRPARAGRIHNAVAVNSITRQRTRRGRRASATAVVVPAAAPRFTG